MASQKVKGAKRIPRHIITVDIMVTSSKKGMMEPLRGCIINHPSPIIPQREGETKNIDYILYYTLVMK